MLLSGMSPTQAGAVARRKLSAPSEAIQMHQKPAMALLDPDKLQAWGHVYFGDPSKADVLVAPKALRRPSGIGQPDSAGNGDGHSERLTIRAHVRPKGGERKPFLIERSMDLNKLRAMVTASPVTPVRLPVRSPGRGALAPFSPDNIGSLRTPVSPLAPSRRRSTVTLSSPLSSRASHQQRSGSREVPIRKLDSVISGPRLNVFVLFLDAVLTNARSRPPLCSDLLASISSHHAFGPRQDWRHDRPADAPSRSLDPDGGLLVHWQGRAD